jgi:hypothetical protein
MKDLVPILPDYNEKIGNMNVSVLAARDAESAGYAHYMAKMLAATEAQREENRKVAEIRKKRHGIDPAAQQPSTQALLNAQLSRPKEKDAEYWERPLPTRTQAQIVDQTGNVDIGERPVTREEVSHVESIRRRPKNTIGQSEFSGVEKERREAAMHAYLCSPGIEFKNLTHEEKKRITQIVPYAQPEPLPVLVAPRSLAGRFMHWLWKRGAPVNKITTRELSVEEADKYD